MLCKITDIVIEHLQINYLLGTSRRRPGRLLLLVLLLHFGRHKDGRKRRHVVLHRRIVRYVTVQVDVGRHVANEHTAGHSARRHHLIDSAAASVLRVGLWWRWRRGVNGLR